MKASKTIGITGASGALGKELTKIFRKHGCEVIGFTHSKNNPVGTNDSPDKWIEWECGKEFILEKHLHKIDILILNHGIYNKNNSNANYENSIEINALSKLKFINMFEKIIINSDSEKVKEIWINTSEAEIFPALNPSYEISKSLIGQLVSYKRNLLEKNLKKKYKIKKLILGPFKSKLNPIGIMNPEFVSQIIYRFANLDISLIIVSPNPLTYIFFPIKEIYYYVYCYFLKMMKIIS